jgi:hypothetical protein
VGHPHVHYRVLGYYVSCHFHLHGRAVRPFGVAASSLQEVSGQDRLNLSAMKTQAVRSQVTPKHTKCYLQLQILLVQAMHNSEVCNHTKINSKICSNLQLALIHLFSFHILCKGHNHRTLPRPPQISPLLRYFTLSEHTVFTGSNRVRWRVSLFRLFLKRQKYRTLGRYFSTSINLCIEKLCFE